MINKILLSLRKIRKGSEAPFQEPRTKTNRYLIKRHHSEPGAELCSSMGRHTCNNKCSTPKMGQILNAAREIRQITYKGTKTE